MGGPGPANSLFHSYDAFNGQPDQRIIRAADMAWVIYAYASYMPTSGDFSSIFQLQAMISYLLTLQSAAPDLTNGLFYEGVGKIGDQAMYTRPARC